MKLSKSEELKAGIYKVLDHNFNAQKFFNEKGYKILDEYKKSLLNDVNNIIDFNKSIDELSTLEKSDLLNDVYLLHKFDKIDNYDCVVIKVESYGNGNYLALSDDATEELIQTLKQL